MSKQPWVELKSSSVRARITDSEVGLILTVDSFDGLGGAIVISKNKLSKFAEVLGWAKSIVEKR